jgi:hypothetical protein
MLFVLRYSSADITAYWPVVALPNRTQHLFNISEPFSGSKVENQFQATVERSIEINRVSNSIKLKLSQTSTELFSTHYQGGYRNCHTPLQLSCENEYKLLKVWLRHFTCSLAVALPLGLISTPGFDIAVYSYVRSRTGLQLLRWEYGYFHCQYHNIEKPQL